MVLAGPLETTVASYKEILVIRKRHKEFIVAMALNNAGNQGFEY